jgi:DNA-binding CsgD family transcriptional regulator
MAGLSPKEAAEQFEVSANTVRSQLKAIYLKTGVHRQVDLLRLAMGLGGVA